MRMQCVPGSLFRPRTGREPGYEARNAAAHISDGKKKEFNEAFEQRPLCERDFPNRLAYLFGEEFWSQS